MCLIQGGIWKNRHEPFFWQAPSTDLNHLSPSSHTFDWEILGLWFVLWSQCVLGQKWWVEPLFKFLRLPSILSRVLVSYLA